ncbi:uncharacterized protein LOC120671834 [Panicum virgatum]|uniref:Probable zinc-ribbon domain-containing protein n=1 Tax=Panicum virgatum TaxID=38727 RepID=A0A8T0S749_PANVG|nr:uncharacterized protein LOC120671834 [Panicum virgatum]KAG2592566.1 hypothetical protein PVAP13_5NG560100 [Panicum virgatum]
MQAEEVRSRFGRCPYCRAMIYQDLTAIIFYCSKCRTPIRGKNPRPTDETEYALAQLEILSADTASVFSDDVEPPNPRSGWGVDDDDDGRLPLGSRSTTGRSFVPNSRQGTGAASSSPYRESGSVREGQRSRAMNSGLNRDSQTEAERSASPLRSRVTDLRPSSRRTRRLSSGDVDARSGAGSGTDSESDVPAPATSYRRRASPLSSQELDVASVLSGLEPISIEKSPLSDPAFQKDLLLALDNLRKLIAAVDHPRSIEGHWQGMMPRLSASCNGDSGGGKRPITRRSSRLMRRLESHLTRALPAERPRRDASTSSASSSRRGGLRPRARHCRPLLGGTPFVVCDGCSEILQLPAALPAGRVSRLKCGGCGEAFELTLPAASGSTDRPNRIFSAPQPAAGGAEDTEHALAWSNLSGEQPRPAGPLHRVLGYSSVSSVLRSRRYDQHN